jgi:hypothetical protein
VISLQKLNFSSKPPATAANAYQARILATAMPFTGARLQMAVCLKRLLSHDKAAYARLTYFISGKVLCQKARRQQQCYFNGSSGFLSTRQMVKVLRQCLVKADRLQPGSVLVRKARGSAAVESLWRTQYAVCAFCQKRFWLQQYGRRQGKMAVQK